MEVKIKLEPECSGFFPKKAHPDDAGYDLYSRIDVEMVPMSGTAVPVGFAMELPSGYEAQIRPRSGLALKHDLMLTNSPGTIDAGYRGEVGVIMFNHGPEEFAVKRGDRIAQMMFMPVLHASFLPVEELDETERGAGGFGSTGTK